MIREGPLDLGNWQMDAKYVRDYLQAVGDLSPLYPSESLVPPMAIAAFFLKKLLLHLDLPPGIIHIGQELQTSGLFRVADPVQGWAVVGETKVRKGQQFLAIEFGASTQNMISNIKGKTTLLIQREE